MRSRIFFREHGQVLRTHSTLREVLWVVAAVLAVVLLLAWGHRRDEAARDRQAFDAGLVMGQVDMQQSVGDAYRQGRADALAELGTVLGTGCMVPAVPAEPAEQLANPAPQARPQLLRWSRP